MNGMIDISFNYVIVIDLLVSHLKKHPRLPLLKYLFPFVDRLASHLHRHPRVHI